MQAIVTPILSYDMEEKKQHILKTNYTIFREWS